MNPLLGQILGDLMGGQQVQQPSAIARILEQTLGGGQAGGLAALISRFEGAGFGPHVQSWAGTGPNLPIAGDQIGQVFSPAEIEGWAQQAGTTPASMRDILAQALPHVIDHLTPGGQVPTQTAGLSGVLGRLLGTPP